MESEYRYDEESQVNVTPEGVPFVEVADFFGPSYTHNSSGHKKDDD
ncbi:hypothetical protein ACFYY2_12040 [Streptomyces sp. NPDC001822]